MPLNRRTFLTQAAGAAAVTVCRRSSATAAKIVNDAPKLRVSLNFAQTLAIVPKDFVGLGYEISSVARPGLLSPHNSVYVRLVRTLGTHGVIRVGGNTSDYASYGSAAKPLSSPEPRGSVVNDAVLLDLSGFLEATGWQLIWGLNLGNGTIENAIQEAKAVMAAAKDHLLAFEIGNEPDLFSSHETHRHKGYTYEAYRGEFRKYRDALRSELPSLPLAGPDAAVATDWVLKFGSDEAGDIKLLTHHYYREGQNPSSSAHKLLDTDPKLTPMLAKLDGASRSSAVPYRICEANSFSGGGRPGVSNTFASALWVLDFMFTLAAMRCAGVNLETGENQLGFVSSYSPIEDDEHGRYWAAPEYYGMLAFSQSGIGRIFGCTSDSEKMNVKAYATQQNSQRIVLTIINKEPRTDIQMVVDFGASPKRFRKGSLLRLLGSSLQSKSGVTLGGAEVSASGLWRPRKTENVRDRADLQFFVPRASAAIVTLTT